MDVNRCRTANPAALATVIQAIHVSLRSRFSRPRDGCRAGSRADSSGAAGGVAPDFTTSGSNHYLFPSDFAKIYDVNIGTLPERPTIAVIGLRAYIRGYYKFSVTLRFTRSADGNYSAHRHRSARRRHPRSNNPPRPRARRLWMSPATSVAPGATIDLVISGNGIDIPMNMLSIQTQFLPDYDISFGACESQNGQSAANFLTLFSARLPLRYFRICQLRRWRRGRMRYLFPNRRAHKLSA